MCVVVRSIVRSTRTRTNERERERGRTNGARRARENEGVSRAVWMKTRGGRMDGRRRVCDARERASMMMRTMRATGGEVTDDGASRERARDR